MGMVSFYPIIQALTDNGKRGRYIWFGSNVILFAFTFFCIPETRDRTLEEIHEMFQAKLPARKFKGHVCVSTQAMGEGVVGKTVDEVEDTADVKGSLETGPRGGSTHHE